MPDTTVKNAGMKETAQKKTDAGETAQDIKTEEDGANKTAEETASKDEAVQNITSDITSEKKPVTEIPSSETFQHKAAAKFEEEVSLKTETKPPPDVIREQKKEEAPLQEDADSPMTLLQRAQQAVTAGDTRNTKAIALELAAAMARLEYEQARQNLATAEQDLLKNGRIIEQSEATVAQKENDLLRAEELLAARDSERNACRERINMIDEELSVMTSERADIDAQIAVLQQKRKEQLNRIENKQTEREEAIDTESRAQTDLEALAQETESIRDRLMEARSETRNEYAARRVIELDIVQAQEEMESRRLALEAIERTLNPEGNTRPKIEESDSLL